MNAHTMSDYNPDTFDSGTEEQQRKRCDADKEAHEE